MDISSKIPKGRIRWVEMLRVTGILLVIGTHASDAIVYRWGKSPFIHGAIPSWWITGVGYKAFTTICVPLLFMLSGYLLLSSSEDTFTFLKKRFQKVLIPLLAWSIIYLWWDGSLAETGSLWSGFKFILRIFLTTPAHFHLWFLYVLIGLYVITPVLRRFIRSASPHELNYLMGVWLIFILVSQFFRFNTGYELALFNQPYISGYLGYFIAGYYLGHLEYKKKIVWSAAGLFALFIAGTMLWAYQLTYDGGRFDTNLFDYMSWPVILLSLTGFIILKHLAQIMERNLPGKWGNLLTILSNASFGIYLVHIIVLDYMNDGILGIRLFADSFHPLLALPVTVLVAFLGSFLIIYPMQKIPLLNKMVP